MAYPFLWLVLIILCTGYVYCQSTITLEMYDDVVDDVIGTQPLQVVGVLGHGAATTYIQVGPVPVFSGLNTVSSTIETMTYIVSASGYQFLDNIDGLTASCNSISTSLLCQLNEGSTTISEASEGFTATVGFAVETASVPNSASPTGSPATLPTPTVPTPVPSTKTNVPQISSSSFPSHSSSTEALIIGVVVGGTVILFLILFTWWLVRKRRRKQSPQIENAQEGISIFDPPDSNDTLVSPLSMVRRLSRQIQAVESIQPEKHEREHAQVDTQETLIVTGQEALNQANNSHEEQASLRQQISELIQIVRRIEERGVASDDAPPDYESQE